MASGVRAAVEGYKPFAAAVAAQCIWAVSTLWVKAAFGRTTMNPMVLVVYRQGIATLVLVPVTVVAKRNQCCFSVLDIIVASSHVNRATVFMNLCYLGLHLGSSSLATAMMNLIPAITFLMALAVG
ncbi:hypothetical protein HU200_037561 [Digitaria exilis]|uniref:WAT1-related protein n=1 Tax=Digitaria exilis TaxID=1010633 RepID=A0A835BD42_9POAL|nr:hypothetical protein HU200_037561 [Digitaria exilis]